MTRIRELDGVRGIAILMVLVWHYFTCHAETIPEGSIFHVALLPTRAFWSGVDLFFVLSGFLIGGILLDNYNKTNFLKVFWIRRCCRILPVLALLLFSCWTLQTLLDSDRYAWLFDDLMPWWTYATFTQNVAMGFHDNFGGRFLGITWSLAVEEQFYVFTPLLILIAGRRKLVLALLPLILIAALLRMAFPGFHTFVNTIFRMDSLLAGFAVAAIYRNTTIWESLKSMRLSLLLSFPLLAMMVGYLAASRSMGDLRFSLFTLLYSSFLTLVLLYQGTTVTAVLRQRWLCFWGSIAYGMYMYHEAVLGLLFASVFDTAKPSLSNGTGLAVTLLAFVLSTIISMLSFRYYERPFLSIGKKYRYGEERNIGTKLASVLPQS